MWPQGMRELGSESVARKRIVVSELGWTKEEEEDDGSGIKWSMWRERPPVGSLLDISVLQDVLWQK